MAYVKLNIIEPENNLAVEGVETVKFSGEVVEMPNEALGAKLYYRWYSSLYEPQWADARHPDYYSIERNRQLRPDERFTWQPVIGTHAINFAVSDRETETLADFMAIEHSGVTGGAEAGDGQCLLHVFRAVPLAPQDGFNRVKRADLYLIAEAPMAWSKPKPETDPLEYEFNTDYHDYNRLQYRWELIPSGSGKTHEYLPAPESLSFGRYSSINRDLFVVYFQPDNLGELSGDYILRLHVEDKRPAGIGRQTASVAVRILA